MIKPLSRGRCSVGALLILGASCLSARAQNVITPVEPNDSIGTATATGLTAGSSGLKVAYGNSADGPHGLEPGDLTGDMDFYKVSANAGQVINVQLKNFSASDDFDGLLGLYSFSGGVATLVALNDDLSGGVSRGSALTYTVPAAGDYYVCSSNWINVTDPPDALFPGQGSMPNDPLLPGTGNGPPGGTGGNYQLFIGLDYQAPIPQFDGTGKANPTPPLNPVKMIGTTYAVSNLKISNTGNAPYNLNTVAVTGPDAARFVPYGLGGPVTIPAGGSKTVKIYVNMAGVTGPVSATLDFTSNDTLDLSYAMTAAPFSPVTGYGTFTAKQVVSGGTGITTMELADQLLDGTIAGTTFTSSVGVINFGTGADGHFPADANFPVGATPGDNFVLQVTGTFTVKEDGDYSFLGYSDDGQRLRIDGDELYSYTDYNVDHTASMFLTAGPHTLEFTMFEGGGGNHAELLIARAQGTFSSYGATVWEPLEATGADTDGDGIVDYMETVIGSSPTVADSAGDLDNDGLSNLGELFAGSNPNNPDTDGDTLKDGVETNTGAWIGLANTGTSPLLTDSDNDSLADNIENPDLASTGVTQPGTDPNKADTDGDTFADYAEIAFGTNPKDPASKPVINYQTVLSENFEAPSPHSAYVFNSLNASVAFEAKVVESDVASHGSVARLTEGGIGGSHNSLSFDYLDITPGAVVQLSFDYRIASSGDAADGFGIGLFRKSAYGSLGVSPGITDGKAWENPTGAGGYANALLLGFGVYGTDTIRLTGPAAPTVPVATYQPLNSVVTAPGSGYSRVILTIVSNSPTNSVVSMDIIRDVDGAAVREPVFDNVLIPDFQIKTEQLRLIAGARTGQVTSQVDLDNIQYSVLVQSNPTLIVSNTSTGFLADFLDGTGVAVNPAGLTVTLNGAPVTVTTSKTGNRTTVSYPGTTGAFFPGGLNTLVFNYTTTAGTPVTETRTFEPGNYKVLPAGLALPASSAGTPGFGVKVVQVDPVILGTPEAPAPQTTHNFLDYREGILSGVSGGPFIGGNVASLTGSTGGVFLSPVVNFEQEGIAAGLVPDDLPMPGIPGTTGNTDNYVFEALTWVEFPATGIYTFGAIADDGFRVSYTHNPVPAVSVAAPASAVRSIAYYPSSTAGGTAGVGIGAPYPAEPFVADVVAASPPTATDTVTQAGKLDNAAEVAGKIILIDRGAGTFAAKTLVAQAAGARAVIIVNENNPTSLPGLAGGVADGITIPIGMISKADGDLLKGLISSGLKIKFGPDNSTTIGKNEAIVETLFSVAVPVPGLYPIRYFSYEGGGGANAEFYSLDSAGGRHLVGNVNDELALKAYATVAAGNAPTISVSSTGGSTVITYTGTLQSSADLGTWTTVNGASSPYTVPAGSPARLFFRAAQ